jgi:hypothetical protein
MRALVAYARRYHVTIVPEQEAFGHLHHVLTWERYAELGETEHGHVLAPGAAGSLPLIRRWFAELDSLFPGPFVHLGADETFELGRGRTAEAVRSEGLGKVYLDFLRRVVDTLETLPRADTAAPRKRYLFWGDVAVGAPALVATLPKSMIAVAWNYWDASGFERLLAPFRAAGMETWVAPGVQNWNRIWPDNTDALPNIQGFARDGQRLGATGLLNTTWDDDGEALFNMTWYGVVFGAAAAWQRALPPAAAAAELDRYAHAFGRVFHGDTLGLVDSAQTRLTAAHRLLLKVANRDLDDGLFWLDPWSDEGRRVAARTRPVMHELRLLAEDALVLLAEARRREPELREPDALDALELGARKADFLVMKFQFADEVARLYARARDSAGTRASRNLLIDASSMNGRLQDLRDGYALLRDLYEQAWRRENRPYWLGNVLARYDGAIQLWIARADRLDAARREAATTHRLPPPEALGIPPWSADTATASAAPPASSP